MFELLQRSSRFDSPQTQQSIIQELLKYHANTPQGNSHHWPLLSSWCAYQISGSKVMKEIKKTEQPTPENESQNLTQALQSKHMSA